MTYLVALVIVPLVAISLVNMLIYAADQAVESFVAIIIEGINGSRDRF